MEQSEHQNNYIKIKGLQLSYKIDNRWTQKKPQILFQPEIFGTLSQHTQKQKKVSNSQIELAMIQR